MEHQQHNQQAHVPLARPPLRVGRPVRRRAQPAVFPCLSPPPRGTVGLVRPQNRGSSALVFVVDGERVGSRVRLRAGIYIVYIALRVPSVRFGGIRGSIVFLSNSLVDAHAGERYALRQRTLPAHKAARQPPALSGISARLMDRSLLPESDRPGQTRNSEAYVPTCPVYVSPCWVLSFFVVSAFALIGPT